MDQIKKNKPPAVVEDDVAFYQEAADAMRQGLASAVRQAEASAEALRRQVATTKAALASRPIIGDYSRKIEAGAFPVLVNGQWVDVPASGFLGWMAQAGYMQGYYSQGGEIRHLGYEYNEQEFLEWLYPLTPLLASYFQATDSAPEWPEAGDEWIADIRKVRDADFVTYKTRQA